ncbi:beta propeller repeat protein [Spongorhabdus nitratireducens]
MIATLKTVFLFICISTLAGCAQMSYYPYLSEYGNEEATGLVIASVSVNSDEKYELGNLVIKRVQKDKKFDDWDMYNLPNELRGTTNRSGLYSVGLPEGKYQISMLRKVYPLRDYIKVEKESENLTFEIKSGQVTDLGRIIFSSYDYKTYIIGKSTINTDNHELFNIYLENYNHFLKDKKTIKWNRSKADEIINKHAIDNPIGINDILELKNGEIIASTNLGVVLKRLQNRKWKKVFQSTKQASISAIDIMGSHQVIVGDELGFIYTIDTNTGEYASIENSLPKGAIIFISHSGEHNKWFVSVKHNEQATLYTASSIHSKEWEPVRTDLFGRDFMNGDTQIWTLRHPGGFVYASGSRKSIACFNYSRNQWTTNKTPLSRSIISISGSSHHTGMGILTSPIGGLWGITAQTHITYNCGESWIKTDTPYSIKATAPIVLSKNNIIESGAHDGDTGIYSTSDKGKTWQKISGMPVMNIGTWYTENNGLFAVFRAQDAFEVIYNSLDSGNTWNVDLTVARILKK